MAKVTYFLTGIGLAIGAAILLSTSVGAIAATAPDTGAAGGYGGPAGGVRFVLENTPENVVTSIRVPVYLPSMPTGPVSISLIDFRYPWPGYGPSVSFEGHAATQAAATYTIPASRFTLDSSGHYKTTVEARAVGGSFSVYNVAEFRIRVNHPGGLIGIAGGQRYTTLSNQYYNNGTPSFRNYDIPFATPCNITTDTTRTIRLDDLDSGVAVGNNGALVGVSVYDETEGSVVPTVRTGNPGDGGQYNVSMTFKPGHKYRLRLTNVYDHNSLIYVFPFDNISYKMPCAWSLTPTVESVSPSVVTPGGSHTVLSSMRSDPVRSTSEYWVLARVVLAPGASLPNQSGGTSAAATTPCNYFRSGATGVQECAAARDGTRAFPAGTTNLPSHSGTAGDWVAGTKLCYGLSVRDRSSSSSGWRHSSLECTVLGHKPRLQVWGGDIRVAGSIDTSTTEGEKSGGDKALFGSWVEYGAFSRGTNSGLATKSQFADGLEDAGSRVEWSRLTFANTPTYGNFNYITHSSLAAQFTPTGATTSAGSSFSVSGKASGTYEATSDVTLSGAVGQGRSIILYAPGQTVTITGNLTYGGGPYISASQIPQLVIVANNIYIQRDVQEVNAWLLANSTIDTCSNVGSAGVMPVNGVLHSNVCDRLLTVNGPIATERLVLKRTAGDGPGGDPAEVFNLRADALLWQRHNALEEGRIRSIMTRELPVRF